MCGKNLLLPQERKLIGKSKHFETSLGYDIMYLLFTTTPKLLNLLGIRYQLSIVYYIPSCRLKRSTWFRMDFHFIPGFVLPKEKYLLHPRRGLNKYVPIFVLTPMQSFKTSPKTQLLSEDKDKRKIYLLLSGQEKLKYQITTLGGGGGGGGKNWEVWWRGRRK